MINDAFDVKEKRKSLRQLARMYKLTKLDPSFQRMGGVNNGSGWSIAHSNEYLQDLYEGFVSNTIILLHAADCLKFAKEENDKESIVYYQDVSDEGHEYVSVDGNNSTSTIHEFVHGHPELKINGRLLEDLPPGEMDDWLGDEKLNVAILRRISIKDACDQFRKVNKQTKLNDQEHRQARWSALSMFIRNTANS
jgi:hypothetical protein